ncbi:hypothetical protein ACOSP7_029080 [Xanthoceras sorbifolium]
MSNPPPLLNSGLELANLVVSSGLFKRSWDSILQLYMELNPNEQIRFRAYHKPDCTVIAFLTSPTLAKHHLQEEGELVSSSSLPLFHFLCTKSNPAFSIHKAAVTLFGSLLDQLPNLKTQINSSVPLIVTGHSVGGSIATLFTLWLLESMNRTDSKRVLCITFGAPLTGDKGLQQAISQNSKWNSCFLHVVANQDLVPRLFVSPHNTNAMQVDSRTVAYQPFGTYLLCSESGLTCVGDPEEVSILLLAMGSETTRNQNPNEELEIFNYTGIVDRVESIVIFQGISALGEPRVNPLRARTILQLEAVGIKRTQPYGDINTLIANMEKKFRSLNRMIFDPDEKLNRMKVYMAYLEWYKKKSMSEKKGYYDSYKNKRFPEDMEVIKFKKKLNEYWKKVVEEAERMPQRENAPLNPRWLYGGTNYRRMVEPLDIADFYSKGLKDYKANGRSQHFMKLEKWLEEADMPTSKPLNWKKLNVSNSLTEDSCFWAHVEEALMLCKLQRNGEEGELTRRNLVKFEEYVMKQMKNYAVSPDIFLEGSSFMQWWREYELIIQTFYTSDLTDFMKNGKYTKYADGSLQF